MTETELTRKLLPEEKNDEFIAIESETFLQAAWRKFRGNKRALIGMVVLIFVVLAALFGPFLCPFSYETQLPEKNAPMSLLHFFGTDKFGRDIFVRILYGARISLSVGFVAAIINLIFGTLYGGIAGYVGGKLDILMMRLVDIIYSVPPTLYVVLIMLMFGPSVTSVMIGISISSWMGMAQIVRSNVMSLKEQEFTMAAFVLGAGDSRILIKHLLVNTMGPIIVTVTLMVPQAIFTEAWLSFLGVGISAPMASWGTLAQDARSLIEVYPMQTVFPMLAICITIFAFNFVGEGLGTALDPKQKH
ncbi:MAG: ABC transporter permease [Lachnospiraceae bacterium]|nr:ABC transporter permease [Lachnospiraceae bacterium]